MRLMDKNHNKFIDALFEWGKLNILSSDMDTQYITEIGNYCEPFIKSEEFECFLLETVEQLKTQVEVAISLFASVELAIASEEDAIWHNAEKALFPLDRMNYLMDVVQFFVATYKEEVAKKAMQKLDAVFEKIVAWLEEGDFSPLRLVVLNESRRHYLEQIPEDERYRFPWYELYAEYNEDTLEIIIQHFDTFLSGKWERLTREIPEERLAEIAHELKRDRKLFSQLKKEAILHKNLLAAVARPSALKLWQLGDTAALDYYLPKCVKEVGPVRVSIELLKNANIVSEADRILFLFLTAFCGPNLDDKQRLSLFKKVEEKMKEHEIHQIAKDKNILEMLKRWFEGKCEDTQLTQVSFNTWIKMMEEKAATMSTMESDETPERLWNAILELQKRIVDTPSSDPIEIFVDWCKHAWQTFKSTVGEQPAFYGALATTASSEKSMMQPRKLEFNNNPIHLSLKLNPKGEYIILSSLASKRVIQCDNEKDYKNLWKYVVDTKNNYWNGCFITKDNKMDATFVQRIENPILTRKESKYKKAIIGISTEKELLEEFIQFVQKLPDMISEGKGPVLDSFVRKIIILVISLE